MNTQSITVPIQERLDALRESLSQAQEKLGDYYDDARKKVVAGAKTTDKAIRTHPYETAAIVLGVGVLLGVFLSRRK